MANKLSRLLELVRAVLRLPVARLEFQRDLGAATDVWDRMWTEVKAG